MREEIDDVKQVVIIRNDVQLRKNELISYVSVAAMKFLIENNEAERDNQIFVNLSDEEMTWLSSSLTPDVFSVGSIDRLEDIKLKSEIMGLETNQIFLKDSPDEIICLAIGPAKTKEIDRITHGLKHI